jgi:multiple inositol-polyphosphate phosphatase/2,3-bisphosphoglycerate 3-phosphatase
VMLLLLATALSLRLSSGTLLQQDDALFPDDAPVPFVSSHISTSTRYKDAVQSQGDNFPSSLPEPPLDTCKPVQLNLVARHGARDPTKKRARQLQKVVVTLKAAADSLLVKQGQICEENHQRSPTASQAASLPSKQDGSNEELSSWPPDWIQGYVVPWEGRDPVGYLVPGGEEEMYDLAKRWKARMPDVLDQAYHPNRFSIFGTQVSIAIFYTVPETV